MPVFNINYSDLDPEQYPIIHKISKGTSEEEVRNNLANLTPAENDALEAELEKLSRRIIEKQFGMSYDMVMKMKKARNN